MANRKFSCRYAWNPYLADTHISELDLVGLNDVLAVKGLRIRGEFRHSERQVVCQLKNGVGQRTVFWIEPVPSAGVADEAGDDQAETHSR